MILYLECNTGISGDMMVAALLDLGADEDCLKKALESMPLQGFSTKVRRVKKAGLDVCDFEVILEEDNHDHDMAYLHGEAEEHHHDHAHLREEEYHHGHVHPHEGEHHHGHAHPHEEEHHHDHVHPHEHRGLPEILEIIAHTDMTEHAKLLTERIFRILARAEAKAHGVPENEVHFHEVGAVDSIVDIVAAAVCLDNLGVEECIVPFLCEGTGTVRCQHGILSVPVPAVTNIIEEHAIKLSVTGIRGELVTPTGAAIVAAVRTSEKLPAVFRVKKVGMGAGKRAYERPSILRAMLLEAEDACAGGYTKEKTAGNSEDVIYKLETNLDDCSGEALGYVMEKLFEAGARDVHYTPVYMKKNRPGYQLNVICMENKLAELEQIIFHETTTLGIRRQKMERSVLEREIRVVKTGAGEARVKVCRLPGGEQEKVYPEYEDVIKLCRLTGKSYQEVCYLIVRAYEEIED